ncbi:MAG: transcriptional repressor [Proteobacteria bacterium]|jgi:Fur family ferric uptake transcriptional regulator|nr:transcriptional repressor [Pseudomonadota bacterium]
MPNLVEICLKKNIKLTNHRKIIAQIISESTDHPDVEELYRKAYFMNPKIGIATVYRAVKMFEDLGLIARHDFLGKGKSRYEVLEDDHHDHLIDITNNQVHEFFNAELENLKTKIAHEMGFELIGHKLELYCKPLKK